MAEPLYFPGLADASDNVRAMSEAQLLAHIDALYGRDNLAYGATIDELRAEALEQTRRDFRSPAGPWDFVETMAKIARANR